MSDSIQTTKPYFGAIGGFSDTEIIRELIEHNGEDYACIACTQLHLDRNEKPYAERDKKRILKEWLDFLTTDTKIFTKLHFNSRVSQALLDAACHQENLVELRVKWGAYTNLSALTNLKNMEFLYIGSGASVQSIEPITKLQNLRALYLEGLKKISDYSPLVALENLEQLVILASILQRTPIDDFEFLRQMPNLRSVFIGDVTPARKYTKQALIQLRDALPHLHIHHRLLRS